MHWKTTGAVFTALIVTFSGASVLASGPDDSDGGNVQEAEYITAWGVVGVCTVLDGVHIGNVCFEMLGEKNVSVEIQDEFFETVRGMYRFFEGDLGQGSNATLLEEGFFCTSTELGVPPEADHLAVYVDGHLPTWFECDALEGATLGTIVMAEL